jgi:hypothetical protein
MKVLYLSPYYFDFIHYPIVKLARDFEIDYKVFFLMNKRSYSLSENYRKGWDSKLISVPTDPEKTRVIKYYGFTMFDYLHPYQMYLQIAPLVKEGEYDLIHTHCVNAPAMLAYLLSKKLKIPYVITTHGTDFHMTDPSFLIP